jgi:hypothetical protein
MVPFATVAEYRARYPDDTTDDGVLLECLCEATDLIMGELDGHDIDYSEPTESFTYRLARICRTVAHRAIGSAGGDDSDVPFGATEMSETADTFSAGWKFANPYGDLFLTQAEKRSLGIGRARACVLSPYEPDAGGA